MTRQEAFDLLSTERDYQNKLWVGHDGASGTHAHTPDEWVLYMQDYLNEAQHIASREGDNDYQTRVMAILRKVGAMAVAAMEQNGCPPRVIPEDITEARVAHSVGVK